MCYTDKLRIPTLSAINLVRARATFIWQFNFWLPPHSQLEELTVVTGRKESTAPEAKCAAACLLGLRPKLPPVGTHAHVRTRALLWFTLTSAAARHLLLLLPYCRSPGWLNTDFRFESSSVPNCSCNHCSAGDLLADKRHISCKTRHILNWWTFVVDFIRQYS